MRRRQTVTTTTCTVPVAVETTSPRAFSYHTALRNMASECDNREVTVVVMAEIRPLPDGPTST